MLVWDKPSPWIGKEDIEEARRLDPIGAEFARLWEGRWISGRGGAVDNFSIDRCFRSEKHEGKENGFIYIAGMDLGINRDHSGVVVVGVNPLEQVVKVVSVNEWVPSVPNDNGTLEVDIFDVERTCIEEWKKWGIVWFGYDPAAGGSILSQRLRKKGLPMREVSFSNPKNLSEMATSFVVLVKSGKLECYEHPSLRRDFGKFEIEHKPPNLYKLKAVSDQYGHADVGTALVICLPIAMKLLKGLSFGGDVEDFICYCGVWDGKESDAFGEVSSEFKDIFDFYDKGFSLKEGEGVL